MNNLELNQELLTEAELIMEEVRGALERQAWNLVVRRAQEVVELSLKSLLKLMGIEYPKVHDVGDTFAVVCKEKKVDIKEEILIEVRRISRQLAEERAPAFYFEKKYTQQQAEEALQSAVKVLEEAKKLAQKLKSV